jgi:8-oxo-dGTP pyrophosphatase MutT (NUDIX family)
MKSTSPEEEPGERSAGFVLYATEEGEKRWYLLLRHCNGGHWGFPKGHIERGEREIEAALREVQEETGIDSIEQIPGFREVSTYRIVRNGRPVTKRVVYFLGHVAIGDVALSSEHLDGKWLSYADAQETLTFAESRRILSAAERYLSEHGEDS